MLLCQKFRHIPDINLRVPQNDPRQQNHPSNTKRRRNFGLWWGPALTSPAAPVFFVQLDTVIQMSLKPVGDRNTLDCQSWIGGGLSWLLDSQFQTQSPSGRILLFIFKCIFYIFLPMTWDKNEASGSELRKGAVTNVRGNLLGTRIALGQVWLGVRFFCQYWGFKKKSLTADSSIFLGWGSEPPPCSPLLEKWMWRSIDLYSKPHFLQLLHLKLLPCSCQSIYQYWYSI